MYTPEEFDQNKTQVMKYILYKKRTESEVRKKFCHTIDENILEDIIEYVKEAGYINDKEYIKKLVSEYMNLKTMSSVRGGKSSFSVRPIMSGWTALF